MPSLTERLAIIIDAKTGGAVKEFDKVAKSSKDLDAQSGKTGKALQSLGLSGKLSGEALKAGMVSGLGAAGAAVIAFTASSVAHFEKTAQSVRAFQRVTGQTAEDASHFVSAFDDMGISAETASSAMFKLSKNVSTGGKALTDLGIGIAHSASGATDLQGTFLNIADAVAKTEDPTKRAQIAFAAFGRQGAAMLPILEKGRKGIQELFKGADLNFSQKQLDSAEDYRLALDHLGDSVGKVQNRIGAGLVPTLAQAAEGLALLIDKSLSATEHSKALSKGFDILTDALPGVGQVKGLVSGLASIADNSDDTAVSMEDAAKASGTLGVSLDALAGKTKEEVDALVEEKKALDDVYSATLAQFDANFAYQDSLNATEDAAAKVAEAQKALNEVTKQHGANSAEARAASEDLSRALLAQQEQALQSATAAGRLAEEQARASGATDATVPKIEAQIAELERQKSQVDGRNVPAIQGMIDKLNSIKSQYTTEIVANTSQAEVKLSGLSRLLGNLTGQTHQVPVTVTGTPLPRTPRPSNATGLYPGLAEGGIVPPRPGGTLVNLAEGGHPEAVVPLSGPYAGRFGNSTFIINMPAGSDGEDVVRAIKAWERRNGTAWRN